MSITPRRALLGSALTTALLGAALTVAPTAAEAADEVPAPTLRWEISKTFDESFSLANHTWGDGATEDVDGVVTFPGGASSYDAASDTRTLAYQGSVTSTFNNPGTGALIYSVTLEDPTVEIEPDGDGVLSAVVTSTVAPDAPSTPTRVDVVTFDADAAAWATGTTYDALTATPAWDGVLPAGSAEATALEIPEGQPVEGRAFDPAFLGHLQPGLRAHFYASGAASDGNKAPAAFVAEAAPAVQARVTSASYANGVTVGVAGAGFRAVTNPGDAGVYVGLAPSGGLPDVSTQEGMESFAASAWVMPNQIVDGEFLVAITAPVADLVKGTSYSVYTWQAHSHSTTTQDTETPVTISWAALKAPASVTGKVTAKPSPTTKGAVRVTVAGPGGKPTGKVTLTLKKGAKQLKQATRTLAGGRTTWALPKLAKGGYKVVASYAGSAGHQAARGTVTFRVR
jgi:hypothetical protein